jgi:hypothetical protein
MSNVKKNHSKWKIVYAFERKIYISGGVSQKVTLQQKNKL